MSKVSPIDQRKADHIKINLEEDVSSAISTGLENFHFVHEALPEINLTNIDTCTTFFSKKLSAPILISSMTGGTDKAEVINRRLAEAAQITGIAMGVGSQRAAIENKDLMLSFSLVRKAAPNALLFANLGAVQLNYGYSYDECLRAVDMIEADALILHLNPLQEAVQEGGDTNFSGLIKKIAAICNNFPVPVIVKEVGWGISKRTASLLSSAGVSAIDVAGAGGTSWSQVEMHRAPDPMTRELAASFVGWGISTVQSIQHIRHVAPDMPIIASGGLKNGIEIAKCIALGARIGGMAGIFLKAATQSTEKVIERIHLTSNQLRICMQLTHSETLQQLTQDKLSSSLQETRQ